MLIKTKRQFYELASRGLCGCTPLTWWSYEDFIKTLYIPSYVCVRSLSPASSFHKPEVPVGDLEEFLRPAIPGTYVIQQIPPPGTKRNIQGELTWVFGQWYLFYSYLSEPMRPALEKGGQHAYGNSAIKLLKHSCTVDDLSDLMEIIEKYSYSGGYPVIEFSVFPGYQALPPGRNTLIWEVRSY